MDTIFTIGRQFGSGGLEVGQKLAEKLSIPLYDKEILAEASKDSGFTEKILDAYDEKPVTSLLYSVAMGNLDTYVGAQKPLSMEAFLMQYHAIERLAEEKKSCIFVGRCADYILEKHANVVNVFITADEESRIRRICEREGINESQARNRMKKTDKNRASYYSYYTEKRWGDAKNYHLCLDSSVLGIDGCVEMIMKFKEIKSR